MRLEEIINIYISNIRKFDTLKPDYTGKDVYEYFRKQAVIADIEPFNNLRFQAKFKNFIETQEQHDYLSSKAKEISSLAQKMFEKRFPKFYQEDPSSKFKKSLEQHQ